MKLSKSLSQSFASLTTVALAVSSFVASNAVAQNSTPAHEIVCVEQVTDEDTLEETQVGRYVVTLDAQGNATQVTVQRDQVGEFETLNLVLNRTSAVFKHENVKNTTEEGVDEETNKPLYTMGIEDIETITAENALGEGIRLRFNDHRYSGHNGSTAFFKRGEVTVESGHPNGLSCEGPLRFP